MNIAAIPAKRAVQMPPDQTLRRQILLIVRQLRMLIHIFDIQRARCNIRLFQPVLQKIDSRHAAALEINQRIQAKGRFAVYPQHTFIVGLDLLTAVAEHTDPPDLGP